MKRSPLTIEQILQWADAHHNRTARRPTCHSGPVAGVAKESWHAIDEALRVGCRGLPGGMSLAKLLDRYRPRARSGDLTVEQILEWADEHYRRSGQWPKHTSGRVQGASFEIYWWTIRKALHDGGGRLRGGTSLCKLLMAHRGLRAETRLTVGQIIAWAKEHRRLTGKWPTVDSGRVQGASDKTTWMSVNQSLRRGSRGLSGGTSLSRLLTERCRGEAPAVKGNLPSSTSASDEPRAAKSNQPGRKNRCGRGVVPEGIAEAALSTSREE